MESRLELSFVDEIGQNKVQIKLIFYDVTAKKNIGKNKRWQKVKVGIASYF